MATIPWVGSELNKMPHVRQFVAASIGINQNTDPISMPSSFKCFVAAYVHAAGSWSGQTLTLQGSVDGVNYITIKDANGADVTWTSDGTKVYPLYASFPYMRGSMSNGGTPAVDLFMTFAKDR